MTTLMHKENHACVVQEEDGTTCPVVPLRNADNCWFVWAWHKQVNAINEEGRLKEAAFCSVWDPINTCYQMQYVSS